MNGTYGLREITWKTDHWKRSDPIGYTVTGLTSEDQCMIGYAGRSVEGALKWSLIWFRNARPVPTPNILFDFPRDALKTVEGIVESRY